MELRAERKSPGPSLPTRRQRKLAIFPSWFQKAGIGSGTGGARRRSVGSTFGALATSNHHGAS
jgi:hypothetical protein